MRQLAAIAVAFVLVAAPASARAQHEGTTNAARAQVLAQRAHIDHLRRRTWHYQDQRHARRSETRYLERNVHALPRLHRLANYWYRRAVTARRALQTYTRARAAATRAREATPTGSIGHYALWHCITVGAYPGAAHEGDGYNGLYTGPLGMTTPWMGHMPPGSDWVHSPVDAVYALAELEYSKSHYSHTWVQGQWPQTSLACMGLA